MAHVSSRFAAVAVFSLGLFFPADVAGRSGGTPVDAQPDFRQAVQDIRSAYLEDRSVEAAHPAEERERLEGLLSSGDALPADAKSYTKMLAGLVKAAEVQRGRPTEVTADRYALWLKETAVAFGLDGEQASAAETLYLGRLRAPDGARPAGQAERPRQGADGPRLGEERRAGLVGGARRVADGFETRSPDELPSLSAPGPSVPGAPIDYERLNRIPAAQGPVTPRPMPVPSPQAPVPAGGQSLPSVVAAVLDTHSKPVAVRLGPGKEREQYKFRGAVAPAVTYTATYGDGGNVEIVVPRDQVPGWQGKVLRFTGLQDHAVELAQQTGFIGRVTRSVTGVEGPDSQRYTAQQVAQAASHLPAVSRADIRTIVVNPKQNPDDEYWTKTYGMKGFRSYMTAGAGRVATIYPSNDAESLPDERGMRVSLLHESGHVFSLTRWGNPDAAPQNANWVSWSAAAASDAAWVSTYAKRHILEDFAETFAAFQASKGGPKFQELKSQVPARFTMIERAK